MEVLKILKFIAVFNFVDAVLYTVENARDSFNFFKQKYDRSYNNQEAEKRGLKNFVSNMNTVSYLNGKSVDKDTHYVLNQFADVDPEEFEMKHAVKIKPYDNVYGNDVRSQNLRVVKENKKGNLTLYNLNNARNLYQEFKQKYNKTKWLSIKERTIHYLRFVKTLVNINKQLFKGENKTLDQYADYVEKSAEYAFS